MIIKNLVARARPYDEVLEFKLMWEAHSNIKMNSYSFPSGHTSTAASIGVGLFIALNKKYSWLFLLFPLLMGWSRITLFVHYPSDVLFGIIIGTIAIVLAYFTSKLLFKLKIVENLTTGEKLF
jgi:undecaprenyl-diphosphatase